MAPLMLGLAFVLFLEQLLHVVCKWTASHIFNSAFILSQFESAHEKGRGTWHIGEQQRLMQSCASTQGH